MYRGGDELKLKLQQLREGMGYYDGKTGNGGSVLEKPTHVSGQHSNNNSLLLPELKSMVPQLQNVKNHQPTILAQGSNINRKKSIEKVINGPYAQGGRIPPIEGIEGSPAGAPYQIYKHANGKIELRGLGGN